MSNQAAITGLATTNPPAMAGSHTQDEVIKYLLSAIKTHDLANIVNTLRANPALTAQLTEESRLIDARNQASNPKPAKPKVEIVKKNSRPLNSYMAFRSYYSTMFAGGNFQQKDISGIVQFLWHNDPFQAKWGVLAKAYSLIRDHQGKQDSPLHIFFKINGPMLDIVTPKKYLVVLGWTIENGEDGGLALRRRESFQVEELDPKMLESKVSVYDVLENSYEMGYTKEKIHDLLIPGTELTAMMVYESDRVHSRAIATRTRRARRSSPVPTGNNPVVGAHHAGIAAQHAGVNHNNIERANASAVGVVSAQPINGAFLRAQQQMQHAMATQHQAMMYPGAVQVNDEVTAQTTSDLPAGSLNAGSTHPGTYVAMGNTPAGAGPVSPMTSNVPSATCVTNAYLDRKYDINSNVEFRLQDEDEFSAAYNITDPYDMGGWRSFQDHDVHADGN